MKTTIMLAAVAMLLTGCERKPRRYKVATYNKEIQERVFMACLKSLPQGPSHITAAGNDWDEVVEQCRISADIIAREDKWVMEGEE